MNDNPMVAPPPVPLVSHVLDAVLSRIEVAANLAREAAERATEEVAHLTERVDTRTDELARAFAEHSHLPVVSETIPPVADTLTQVPTDVAGASSEMVADTLGEPEPPPRAPEPVRTEPAKRRHSVYRL